MRILHLEDNSSDAELAHLAIHREWPNCEVEVANSLSQFSSRLEAREFDLILSDFNMIGFTGLDAMEVAKSRHPELPFIFLSGTIGEERAVEAMRHGAADYVSKDRCKRLIPAIKRAVDSAQQRRERKNLEEQLLRAQRLESIGMLASGIAHDLNNVLAPILLGVSLLRENCSDTAQLSLLDNIERSTQRGAGLVKQILGFIRGSSGEIRIVNTGEVLQEGLALIGPTLTQAIRLETEMDADLWPMRGNSTQLHQIILNLCINARDAMPQGGILRISARNHWAFDDASPPYQTTTETPYLLLEVTDNGTGIPPDVLAHIWEPFFTTKPRGQGTGLGLATVRSIIRNLGGTITVNTAAGRGTTFHIMLPACPGQIVDPTCPGGLVSHGMGEMIPVVARDRGAVESMSDTHSPSPYA